MTAICQFPDRTPGGPWTGLAPRRWVVSPELLSILALVAMFVIATVLPVNMGMVAFVGAFLVGTLVADQTAEDIAGGFPAELFLSLVGITYLFAIPTSARNNSAGK